MKQVIIMAVFLASAAAQIPLLGRCPEYQPMTNFDLNRFLGRWYEAERYFTVSEVGHRCVSTTYENLTDGRIWMSSEIKSSFAGLMRVEEGEVQLVGKVGEGKILVNHTTFPIPYETNLEILDTDYKSYAVLLMCNEIGPIHTYNARILTRDRLSPASVLQTAYGILDKYKISTAFFVKTNQVDCAFDIVSLEAEDTPVDRYRDKNTGEKNAVKKDDGKLDTTAQLALPVKDVDKPVEVVKNAEKSNDIHEDVKILANDSAVANNPELSVSTEKQIINTNQENKQ